MVLMDLILPSEGTLGAVFGQEAANYSINPKIAVMVVIYSLFDLVTAPIFTTDNL